MPDADGYPTKEELETIEKWDCLDLPGWFAFIKSVWWMAEWGWHEADEANKLTLTTDRVFSISTGGWSGNEEIIEAMKKNRFAWYFSWWSSMRGGHFVFKLHSEKQEKAKVATGGE